MSVICRFAPSPTGYLHVGNIRTALINWLFAKNNNGKFILRIDDTDIERSTEEYVEQIKKDMLWLGLNWQEEYRQSHRFGKYEDAKQKLINEGRLYPCFETPEEIEMKRKMLLSRGKPPIYDRAALKLSQYEIEDLIAQGRNPHYRFKLNDEKVSWHDKIRGEISFEAANLSDPILIRENGTMTYMLCSVVDDIEFNITHVVRGEDHISNTAIGIQLYNALGGKEITYAHLSLLKTNNSKISKRYGGNDIIRLAKQGIEPMAINSLLAKIGSSQPIEAVKSVNRLIQDFDFSIYGKSQAVYDEKDLYRLNHKVIAQYNIEDVAPKLKDLGIEIDSVFWESIKNNIGILADAKEWYDICKTNIKPLIKQEDMEFLKQASLLLPEGKWDEHTWQIWIDSLKAKLGRKGSTLFMPIRKALTGKEKGPELKDILPLIGKDRAYSRLNGLIK